MINTLYSISRVERETGLSKDVLRMWERRYGFPMPSRSESGERMYDVQDIDRLKLIKHLMDLGHRPGRMMTMSNDALRSMLLPLMQVQPSIHAEEVAFLIELLQNSALQELDQRLSYWLLRYGLEAFLLNLLPALLKGIGDAWQSGVIMVYHEHLITELLQNMLRRVSMQLPSADPKSPRVLLTTLPGEQHGLGLLMVENVLKLDQVFVMNLGLQTPIQDIIHAVREYQIDIVSLSLSESTIGYDAQVLLLDLGRRLATHPETSGVVVWLGGEGAKKTALNEFPFVCHSQLSDLMPAIEAWRSGVTK